MVDFWMVGIVMQLPQEGPHTFVELIESRDDDDGHGQELTAGEEDL